MANILIYGAGAIGSLMGYILSQSEGKEAIENLALLGRKSHIDKVKEDGLKVILPEKVMGSPKSCHLKFRHCFSSLQELERSGFAPDAVIICVKTPSLEKVKNELITYMAQNKTLEGAEFILLMNGMGNREALAPVIPNLHEGITSVGVKFSEDGLIELKGRGKTIFEAEISENIRGFIKRAFEEKGFEVDFALSQEFKRQQWMKLIVNSAINPLTAILRRENRIVLSDKLQGTVQRVVEECVKVASKEGLEIDGTGALDIVLSVAIRTAENTSSMLQDVLRGKRTEIDSINGYVISLGRKHSLEVPVNETLYTLVKAMEQDTGKRN